MAEKTDEQLSALMDGECSEMEIGLALRRLAKDADLKERWERYHLISDAIRNDLPNALETGFSSRVMAAIDQEAPLRPMLPSAPPSWQKPLAGFGLAASVMVVAAFTLMNFNGEPSAVEPLAVSPKPVAQPPQQVAQATPDNSERSRLNNYLLNHNEFASRNSVQGVLPYVRIVGYQPNP